MPWVPGASGWLVGITVSLPVMGTSSLRPASKQHMPVFQRLTVSRAGGQDKAAHTADPCSQFPGYKPNAGH